MRHVLLTSLLLACLSLCQAQSFSYSFNAQRQVNTVFLSWTIHAGSTCNGIRIERSLDSIAYEEIGNISGQCGDANFDVIYTFTDEAPLKNKTNYYRLQFGLQGYSEVKPIVFVDYGEAGYKVAPHPIQESAVLYFPNENSDKHSFYLYNLNGKLLYEQHEIVENYLPLQLSHLTTGNYIFKLMVENKQVHSGKLLVQ